MKIKYLILLCVVIVPVQVFGQNTWYYGKVSKIQSLDADGSFIVHLDNQTIKDSCKYNRVSFTVDNMGLERTRIAFAMALAAFSSDKQWGVVVDIPTEVETVCYASTTASQGAGISN